MARVLHILSQRPSLTGSGVTLEALVRHAAASGWEQRAIIGVPGDDASPEVGGLPGKAIRPLRFDSAELPFPVPGMSDVMPYCSTRFQDMDARMLAQYEAAWVRHLRREIAEFVPDVIHSHHVWLLSSLLKDIAPEVPVVTQCHATGLRQMELCPALAEKVRVGCWRNERFAVLHEGHADQLAASLAVARERIHVIGAGYREDCFCADERTDREAPRLVYVGKYSAAKGLPCLLDAVDRLVETRPGLRLEVAGSGGGPEADALAARMRAMGERVRMHGQVDQHRLAQLLCDADVCVLPSFFEGLPLVLVEAYACGCRVVATALPGIEQELAPTLGGNLHLVQPPRLEKVDRPIAEDVPAFVDELVAKLDEALAAGRANVDAAALESFTWSAVFGRVEALWRELIER
jgi:alpha-maltose-1-phosphate synthase